MDASLESKSLCYSGHLMPIQVGHVLTIKGKTKEAAEIFEISLGSDNGKEDFGDIQLNVAVNFEGTEKIGSQNIARRSHKKGAGWDKNDDDKSLLPANTTNRINRGGDFKIAIFADQEMFYLTIDDKPFCFFKYRMPLDDIKRLSIYGDVEQIFEVNHTKSQIERTKSEKSDHSAFNGSTSTLEAGTAIVFSGVTSGNPEDMSGEHLVITLIESGSATVLLQVISNFRTGEIFAISQDGVDTLSLKVTGNTTQFPFKTNSEFKAAIGVTSKTFIFTVNGQNVLHYPFEKADFLGNPLNFQVTSCEGLDVKITGVDVFMMNEGHGLLEQATEKAEEITEKEGAGKIKEKTDKQRSSQEKTDKQRTGQEKTDKQRRSQETEEEANKRMAEAMHH